MAIVLWDPAAAADTLALAQALSRPDRRILRGGAAEGPEPLGADVLVGGDEGIALRQAMGAARREGAAHLLWVDVRHGPNIQTVEQLIRAARANPDAILLGRRRPVASSAASQRTGDHQRWARFWLRIQTGRRMAEPLTGLRVYPQAVLDHITLHQKGPAARTEILVKSLWAEVPLLELVLMPPSRGGSSMSGLSGSPLQALYLLMLNVHWSMRSVLPIPHRKIVANGAGPGEKISVLRPLRSLRTLLSENVTPGRLAASGALGVLLGTLPLIAFHTLAILFAANYFRLNKVAALSVSQLCMPPIVPALCIELGYFMRHGSLLTEISLETLGYQALERLYEWLLGSLVLAPLLSFLVGGLILIMSWALSKSMARITS